MEILVWIGLSQSLFEGILIATKKQINVSDRILAAWLLLLANSFLFVGLEYQVFEQPLITNSFLLINPAFYLYIKSLTKRNFTLKWIQLLHLLPFVFFEIIIMVFRIPLLTDSLIYNEGGILFTVFYVSIAILSWIIYSLLSVIMVHKHRKNLANEFSNIDKNVSLGWLLFIVVIYISFWVIILAIGIYQYLSNSELLLIHNISYSFFLFLVYVLGYYGLKQRIIFRESVQRPAAKYENSVLSVKRKEKLKNALFNLFEKEQPYINPDFNMDILSQQLGYPKHQITEVLSTEIQQNFFQFVNTYRIEAVKKHLADKNNPFSIEAIAYECGFNSKSTFYTIFKKFTGKTPAEFRKTPD